MHPSEIQVMQVISIDRLEDLWNSIDTILDIYKEHNTIRVRVLVAKDKEDEDNSISRKIVHKLLNELNIALRRIGYNDNIRYLIYHHSKNYYGILLLDSYTARMLGV
jgi:hypothetical protein